MRRLEQNGEILRALLISGTFIGMLMIVGIHPVTGTPYDDYVKGDHQGENDCLAGKPYNPNQGPNAAGNDTDYRDGYNYGWNKPGPEWCKPSPDKK